MNMTTPSTKDQLIGKLCETSTGSIRLVDVMGDDHRVVQAARISFGKQAQVINADKDRALLRYLMRNRHTSPFEQCELTFIVECPMDLWRQWVRHRTANVNEYSTRYAPAFNNAAMAATRPDSWRLQATNNKQGSDGLLDPIAGGRLSIVEQRFQSIARDVYKERIEAGVAKEQARKDLPLSTMTTAYWKSDLHNLFHFLELRMAGQLEIREFADVIFHEFVQPLFPWSAEAFVDYVLDAVTLTGPEIEVLKLALVPTATDDDRLGEREKTDLLAKIRRINDG